MYRRWTCRCACISMRGAPGAVSAPGDGSVTALEAEVFVQGAGGIVAFGSVVLGRFGEGRRGEPLARAMVFLVQGGHQALAGLLVERQAAGTIGQVFLDVLVVLGELAQQAGSGG